MPRSFQYQNMNQYADMSWARVYTSLACVVRAVYFDNANQPRVNVVTIRSGVPFVFVFAATPSASVGDRGLLLFADGRRDIPVYYGIVQRFYPASVTVTTVGSTLTVTFSDGSQARGVRYIGAEPLVGDSGLVFAADGNAATLVYLGSVT